MDGWLHWVAVRREYQGKGLAKPLIYHTLQIMRNLGYPAAKVHTQTTGWYVKYIWILDFTAFGDDYADIGMLKLCGVGVAMGKLWCVFSGIFILLGLPLLAGQNAAVIIVSVLGIVFEMIGTMIVYTRIEEKYRKK